MVYLFEDCELDTGRYALRRDGEVVRLEPQVLDVLAHLVSNHGRVVTKEELLDEVWETRFVSEASLTSRIHAARQAVGDDGSKQALIRTVRNRGYEFVAPVTEHPVAPVESQNGAGEADTEAPLEQLTTESSLPAALLDLIGRDELLVELREALDGHRLVTLIGPGGVGKTAVAYELARSLEARYADGVSTVQFVTVSDAEATVESLATALDVQRRRDTSLEDAVVNVLRSRHTLLLLDNCEHLIEPLATVVERIMQEAPEVSVLATSRQPLALPGERLWPIEPLGVGALDAQAPLAELRLEPVLRLFVDRATAADPRFVLDESTVGPTIGICQRLDGMPLALELAAARVRTIGVEEIEERLNERFRLLRTVRRGGDPRHQTLHGAVQWSYDLLDADEQQLFDELSIFAEQFDIAAVAAVCGDRDELDALDLVTALAERSMLAVRAQASGVARYEVLETLRDYGRANLDDTAGELLGKRHMSYYVGLARQVEIEQRGPSESAANARAEAAFADLRAAQRFASEHEDVGHAFGLVSALGEYGMRSMRYEALTWADTALGCAGASEHSLFPTVRGLAAYGAWIRGEFDRALELADAVEQDERARGGPVSGLAQRVQANVHFAVGDVEEGMDLTRRQLTLAEEVGEPSRIAHAAYMRSISLSSTGELDAACELAARALSIGEQTGSLTDLASGWVALGFAAHDDPTVALDAFARADEIASEGGNRWMSAFARTESSGLQLLMGDVDRATSGLAEAVDTWYRAGEWSQQWLTLARCVVALSMLGENELAVQVIGAVERWAAMGTPPVMASLGVRTRAAAEELTERLGVDRYRQLHAQGGGMPVIDVVHRTRAVLLGQELRD